MVPVIATVLLLIIVSAAVIVIYSYVSGATVVPDTGQQVGRMLEKLKPVEVKGYADGQFRVFIMNTGNVDSVIDMFYVKGFVGETLLAIPASSVATDTALSAGEVMECRFDPFLINSSPWDWFEIVGVTERGNKVITNLYGYFTGAYELGVGPIKGEYDYAYSVFDVTIDGVSTNPSNLPNLTAIDDTYFGYLANDWSDTITNHAAGVFDFDLNTTYNAHFDKNYGYDLSHLEDYGSSTVLHFNVKSTGSDYFLSSIFNGTSSQLRYPTIVMTMIFDLEGSGWNTLNGTIQFFDWSRNEYVTSGNGYFEYHDGRTLPDAFKPPAASGYKNITVSADAANLLGPHGEWSIMVNMSNTDNSNLKLDYFAVLEVTENATPFKTIFWYKLVDLEDENNVTQIIFSTTGIFPTSGVSYEYLVYNFDEGEWETIGVFQGSSSMQTQVFEILWPCSSYISATNMTQARIIPTKDLPSQEMVYIEQTRMIFRQIKYTP